MSIGTKSKFGGILSIKNTKENTVVSSKSADEAKFKKENQEKAAQEKAHKDNNVISILNTVNSSKGKADRVINLNVNEDKPKPKTQTPNTQNQKAVKIKIKSKKQQTKTKTEHNVTNIPIIAFVGHIDHGKTSLIDYISKQHTKEYGAITQSVGFRVVETEDKKQITILDTPGHEIFTHMREIGINISNIAILIISATDGVQEQTVEAIKQCKRINMNIIVCITKTDIGEPSIMAKIPQQLLQHDIQVEQMGGDIPCIETSVKNGNGISELLDSVYLMYDMQNIDKQSDNNHKTAFILDYHINKHQGKCASIISSNQIIKKDMWITHDNKAQKIKQILNWEGKPINALMPTYPGMLTRLQEDIASNSTVTLYDEKPTLETIQITEKRNTDYSDNDDSDILIPVIIKSASSASNIALESVIEKINTIPLNDHEIESKFHIIKSGIGSISKADIQTLAQYPHAIMITLGIKNNTQDISKYQDQILSSNLMHEVIEDIENILSKHRRKHIKIITGEAVVKKIFPSKTNTIYGCYVQKGEIRIKDTIHILRNDVEILKCSIYSLKHIKKEVQKIGEDTECGICLNNSENIQINEGDIFKCYAKS